MSVRISFDRTYTQRHETSFCDHTCGAIDENVQIGFSMEGHRESTKRPSRR